MSTNKFIVADFPKKTILISKKNNASSTNIFNYQTEQALENELIETLQKQGYEYLPGNIREEDLKVNLRKQLEKLNRLRTPDFAFTDDEWYRFYREQFEGTNNEGFQNRTKKIQLGDCVVEFKRDDGTLKNITLMDKQNPTNNYVQVINQFINTESRRRGDVTILVNGLPMVHLELKQRGISLKTAFNQINRYQETFFKGLFEFVQIFIISNGTDTKYYSNTTRKKTNNNSFVFTSYWSYENNWIIRDIREFTKTFLSKDCILQILCKYCVLDSSGILKILRPYQIAAIERTLDRVNSSIANKVKEKEAGGYIWHTTGSGKTLTSFKAAQLALQIPEVKKVLFIVDRKDLDSQTYGEYKKWLGEDEQMLDNTSNTNKLLAKLNENKKSIVITTIQKLNKLLNDQSNSLRKEIFNEKVVIFTDECHRSFAGEKFIENLIRFKNRCLFGFTGTPLLIAQGEKDECGRSKVRDDTKETFGKCLHSYKISNAIGDGNVLPFRIDYIANTEPTRDEEPLDNPWRIAAVAKYVLDSFNNQTLNGTFNAMMAADSISSAIKYYEEFKRQQQIINTGRKLKIAMIFSSSDTGAENKNIDSDKEQALKNAIEEYEKMFEGENLKINGYDHYRESISKKMKAKAIDILLVVDMFLTGFDAPCLNTVYIDKNLKNHGLIQAFSRANRIKDSSKKHGNIICFRNLKPNVDDALLLFALDEDDWNKVEVPSYAERIKRYLGVEKYLMEKYPLDNPEILQDKEAKEDFLRTCQELFDLSSGLACDDKFYEDRKMTNEEKQNYKSRFMELIDTVRNSSKEEEEGEIPLQPIYYDLEILRTDDVDVGYIQNLINDYRKARMEKWDEEKTQKLKEQIINLVRSHTSFRKEIQYVQEYLELVDQEKSDDMNYQQFKNKRLGETINLFCSEENLNTEKVKKQIDKWMQDGEICLYGKKNLEAFKPDGLRMLQNPRKYQNIMERVKKKVWDILDKFNIFS